MLENGISLGRWFGVRVAVDRSWFIIAFLLSWSFYSVFETTFPEIGTAAAAVLGIGSAVLFFGSVVLHELSHAVMARRLGIPVKGITLFIFGGATQTSQEAETSGQEFAIAVVGPITSLILALCFWMLVNLTGDLIPPTVRFGLGQLGWLNLGLGLFNLLPGFPLDGGRVLRSIVWQVTGSMDRATRMAATGGKVIASILIALGFLELISGNFAGLWYAAIGWFLFQAAEVSGRQVEILHILDGLVASDLMSHHLVVIDADATLQRAVDDYFLHYDHSAFPVRDEEGDTVGILTLRGLRQVARDQWPVRQVWTVMTRPADACTVPADLAASEVIERLNELEDRRVLVEEGGEVVGIITPRDIARWVRRSHELGLDHPG